MKKFSDTQIARNKRSQATNTWSALLQCLRLLVLSLTRMRIFIAGNVIQRPVPILQNHVLLKPTTKTEKIKTTKLTGMKPANRFIKWGVMLLFVFVATFATAQVGPFPLTGDDNVCVGQTKSYGVTETPGSSYAWTITPGIAGTDWVLTLTSASGNTITVQWLTPGTYTLSV